MGVDAEIERAYDAIEKSMEFMEGLSIFQKQRLNTIMKMSYYLGMLEYSKEHEKIRQLFTGKDDDE